MSRLYKQQKYRNPGYMGGLCAVCRKKYRNHTHPEYPSMCDSCRDTRLRPFVEFKEASPDVSTARSAGFDAILQGNGISLEEARRFVRETYGDRKPQANYDYEKDAKKAQTKCVHGLNIDHCGKLPPKEADNIQNLNDQLHPLIKRILR